MKAILLAGGFGTRLRPITDTIPKCLVKVGKKTILEHWLIKLENLNCDSVLINTHYLSTQVENFLDNYSGPLKLKVTHEKILLGTAGTLIKNIEFFQGEQGLLIHADNFTNNNLREFVNSHKYKPNNCILTMLTFNTNKPEKCGIVKVDSLNIVQSFHEKSLENNGNKANGAIYTFDKEFMDWIIKFKKCSKDFSLEILPELIGRIFTHHINDFYIDIGTPESLLEANSLF